VADLTAQKALSQDIAFQGRVYMAGMFYASKTVQDEPPATPHHAERVNYATLFLRVPDAEAPKLAAAVAANTRIAGDPALATDQTIKTCIVDVWNAFAGVVTV
jgi:hypothetical protein